MQPGRLQGCTETFVYRPDGAPLELLYTPAKDNLTQRYWYELDGHGDVVALIDPIRKVADRYDLWGAPSTDREDVPQPFRYAGCLLDRELALPNEAGLPAAQRGWYWLSVRHYDPILKRFLQPDPSEQEWTRSYVYAGDDLRASRLHSESVRANRGHLYEAP